MTSGDTSLVSVSRRGFLRAGATLGAGLLLPADAAFASSYKTTGPPRRSSRQATLFGATAGPLRYPNVDPIETKPEMRARVCAALAVGTLPVERIFNEATWVVPAAGTPAIVSFTLDPSAVAAKIYDADIVTFVEALDRNTPYWLCLNHECDQPTRPYTPEQQVAGFQHFASVVRAVGKSNVKLASILMSWTLTRGADYWRQWYPGPEYVDALGWDAYWRPTQPNSAADVFGPALAVSRFEGKPMLICETSMGAPGHGGQQLVDGVYVDIPDEAWAVFAAETVAFLNNSAVAAVTWFELNKDDGHWLLEGHAEALLIWSAAARASMRVTGDHLEWRQLR